MSWAAVVMGGSGEAAVGERPAALTGHFAPRPLRSRRLATPEPPGGDEDALVPDAGPGPGAQGAAARARPPLSREHAALLPERSVA